MISANHQFNTVHGLVNIEIDIFEMDSVESIDVFEQNEKTYHSGGWRIEGSINGTPAGTHFYPKGMLGTAYFGEGTEDAARRFLAAAHKEGFFSERTNINQIVFDSNGNYYTAESCDTSVPFDITSKMDGGFAYPEFDGQVANYCSHDMHLGILVHEISEDEYERMTELSGGSDVYITNCGRYWTSQGVGEPTVDDIQYFLSVPQYRKYEEIQDGKD